MYKDISITVILNVYKRLDNLPIQLEAIQSQTIKPKEISKYFTENFKETVHPSQLDLKQEINKVGNFSLTINLHSDLVTELHVTVEKKELK